MNVHPAKWEVVQRQPFHNFSIVVEPEAGKEVFLVTATAPFEHQRPHLGNLNFLKIVEEAIVATNIAQGAEDGNFEKKLLVEVAVSMLEEVTDTSKFSIRLIKTKERKKKCQLWQWWRFELGKNQGKIIACYCYKK